MLGVAATAAVVLITEPGFLMAELAMILRDTGVFEHGFGVPSLVVALAALLGHPLVWRSQRQTGSMYRLA